MEESSNRTTETRPEEVAYLPVKGMFAVVEEVVLAVLCVSDRLRRYVGVRDLSFCEMNNDVFGKQWQSYMSRTWPKPGSCGQ